MAVTASLVLLFLSLSGLKKVSAVVTRWPTGRDTGLVCVCPGVCSKSDAECFLVGV